MRLRSYRWTLLAALIAPFLLAFAAWAPYVPAHFPAIPCPPDNALSQARVELGRKLFFDPILSRDSSISCGSCHKPALAFADQVAVSPGIEGRLAQRNAPSLANVAYHPALLRDGGVPSLEMQVLVPVQEHAEMDFNLLDVSRRLLRDSAYTRLSRRAYARVPDPYVVTRALSAYERTLLSGDSPWDEYMRDSIRQPLKGEVAEGWKLFRSARLGCSNCHSGLQFTDFSYRNNGLHAHYADSGRARITEMPQDAGLFKVPGLRNLAWTAPYMHDGSLASLEAVVLHYEKGGAGHPNQSPLLRPFRLTDAERVALIAFLREGLADPAFIRRHQKDAQRPIPASLIRTTQ